MRVAAAVVAVLVVGTGLIYLLRADEHGPTAEALESKLEPLCGEVEISDVDVGSDLKSAANDAVRITCADGYVNPYAHVYRFDSESDAKAALDQRTGRIAKYKFCLVGADAFNGSLDESFVTTCRELDGTPVPAVSKLHGTP